MSLDRMERFGAALGRLYRRLADRADPDGAMVWTGLTATVEPGGIEVRRDHRGARLYYREGDLRLAVEQADRPADSGGLGWIVPPAQPGGGGRG